MIEPSRKLPGHPSVPDLRHQLRVSQMTFLPMSSTRFSTSSHSRPLLHLSFLRRFLLSLLTSLMTMTHCLRILTSTKPRNAKLLMLIKNLLKTSSLKPKVGRCRSLLPTPFGGWLFLTSMSTLRSYSLLWTQVTTLTTRQKNLPTSSHC